MPTRASFAEDVNSRTAATEATAATRAGRAGRRGTTTGGARREHRTEDHRDNTKDSDRRFGMMRYCSNTHAIRQKRRRRAGSAVRMIKAVVRGFGFLMRVGRDCRAPHLT
jgi:hypothetical protein